MKDAIYGETNTLSQLNQNRFSEQITGYDKMEPTFWVCSGMVKQGQQVMVSLIT